MYNKAEIDSLLDIFPEDNSEFSGDPLEKIRREIESEIECPRCYDVMTLCSDFDSLYYVCYKCDFVLYTVRKNLAGQR
jgi:hypothetical protein